MGRTFGLTVVAMLTALALLVPIGAASASPAAATAKAPAGKCSLKAKTARAAATRRACKSRARARARRQRQKQTQTPSAPVTAPAAQVEELPAGRQISPVARCEIIIQGPCDIYTDLFWEMQAKYAAKEIATGVYPTHPECTVICPAAIAHLYPDGSIGYAHWVADPCAPAGWRLMTLEPPCTN